MERNTFLNRISDMMFMSYDGLDFYDNYDIGWKELSIPEEWKTINNYQTYCYLKCMGLDAQAIFLTEYIKCKKIISYGNLEINKRL